VNFGIAAVCRPIGLAAISLTVKFTYDKIDRTNGNHKFSEKVA